MRAMKKVLALTILSLISVHATSNSSYAQTCYITTGPFNISHGRSFSTIHPIENIITQAITSTNKRSTINLIRDKTSDAVGIDKTGGNISIIQFNRSLLGVLGITVKDIPVGIGMKQVVAGDLDNDSRIDLVALRDSEIDILWNLGKGTFSAPVPVVLPDLAPSQIALGDFNNDQRLDIATNASTLGVATLRNLGGRKFEAISTGENLWHEWILGWVNPMSLTSIRPDTSGRGGLVIGNLVDGIIVDKSLMVVHSRTPRTDGSIQIGIPRSQDNIALGASVPAMAVGNFNKDSAGRDDLITLSPDANQLSVLMGQSDFLVKSDSYLTGATNPSTAVTAADLNLDGASDAAVANGLDKTITFFKSALVSGAYKLTSPTKRTDPHASDSIGAIDVDGDGDADLLTGSAGGGVTLFVNLTRSVTCRL